MSTSTKATSFLKGCALAAALPCLTCSGVLVWLMTTPPPPPDTRPPVEKLAEASAVLHLKFPPSTELLHFRRDPDFERPFSMVFRMPSGDFDRFTKQSWFKETVWTRADSPLDAYHFSDDPFRPKRIDLCHSTQVRTEPNPGETKFTDHWAINLLVEDAPPGSRTVYLRAFDPF